MYVKISERGLTGNILSHPSFGYAAIYWRNWLCKKNYNPKAKCVAWLFVLLPNTPVWAKVSRVAVLYRRLIIWCGHPFLSPHRRITRNEYSGNKGQLSRLMLSHIIMPYKTERSSIKLESDDHRRRTQVILLKLRIPVVYSGYFSREIGIATC